MRPSMRKCSILVNLFSDLQAKVQNLAKGTGDLQEISFEERAERLNHLFMDKIIPFYREIIAQSLQAQFEEQFLDFQTQEYLNRNQKAEMVRSRYEVITREYNSQNVNFDTKHK